MDGVIWSWGRRDEEGGGVGEIRTFGNLRARVGTRV
jgi:hypothetical protein